MRINVKFKLDKPQLPVDYRRMLLSFLKHSIQSENIGRYEELYGKGTISQKPFTFWARFQGVRFEKEKIILERDEFCVVISTSDYMLGIDLYNSFIKQREKKYPLEDKNNMKLSSVIVRNSNRVTTNEIIIKMMSPLVVRKHVKGEKDKYFIFNEEGFEDAFKNTMLNKFKKIGLREDEVPRIEPIMAKKVIVKAFGTSIPSNRGIFKLIGNPEILNELYLSGIGSRSSQGFGSFEIM